MEIRHKSSCDGMVHTISFVEDGKMIKSVGAVLPGVHDFGFSTRRERFTVTLGRLHINGRWFDTGESATVGANTQVRIRADAPATYLCQFCQYQYG